MKRILIVIAFCLFSFGCNEKDVNYISGHFYNRDVIASGKVECCDTKIGFWNTYEYILFEDGKLYKQSLNNIVCSYPLSMLREKDIEIVRIDKKDFIKIKGVNDESGSN